jgi:hypothetical protein
MTYWFYSLSWTDQLTILLSLQLLQNEDRSRILDPEIFSLMIKRAKEQKILYRLWDRIRESSGNFGGAVVSHNPFLM